MREEGDRMELAKDARTVFEPCCRATTIGSMPHRDAVRATDRMLAATPCIPSWVQLPRRSAQENVIVQFTEGLPGLRREGGRLFFDTESERFPRELEDFYAAYLAVVEEEREDALEYFRLSPDYVAGFWEMLTRLSSLADLVMPKGQVTGPITLGTNIFDVRGRFAYYDPVLRDILVKMVVMKARWQMRCFQKFAPSGMIFFDEPALLYFGSPLFITIGREDVVRDIDEVAAAVRAVGGISGIHCEENTDWSLLMETQIDLLDFDAYSHFRSIAMHVKKLRHFLERGGSLGWGIVPTLNREAAARETSDTLLERFERGLEELVAGGLDGEMAVRRSLITPTCGMGGILTEELAERVLLVLRDLSGNLRRRYAFE